MRSGGTIFGDIIMAEGVTIDGVDIDTHAHTGEDGSVRIKSTDIDYETPRGETTLLQSADGSLLEVSINAFESSIKNGGVPTVNAVVNISIPDSYSDKYEYEIVYLEAK
jgi:predicted amidohydrolase